MITEDQRDELIFDFLEGNLSADEEEAFRILKDESELFNREVRLWENTYITEGLPAIDALEKKLFVQPTPQTNNFLRISTLILVLFFVCSTQNDRFDPFPVLYSEHLPAVSQDRSGVYSVDSYDCSPEVKRKTIVEEKNPVESQPEVYMAITPTVSLAELHLKPLVVMETPSLPTIGIDQLKTKVVKTIVKKNSSREQKRLIRQKRWDDSNKRKAAEFQKGRVPYVVPLNNNNF